MPRDAEIALARTAAPANISARATVKVLTKSGFTVAQQGDNGNVCMVMRGFSAPTYTPAQFRDLVYDPTVRAPICFTAPAAKTAMPYYEMRTKLAIAGQESRPDRRGGEVGLRERRHSRAAMPTTFAYMWSAHQHLASGIDAWHPHVMIFVPDYENAMVGGNAVRLAACRRCPTTPARRSPSSSSRWTTSSRSTCRPRSSFTTHEPSLHTDDASAAPDRGVFDARYLAFLATVEELRPSLHRYCARMTGSVADGEDVVQDALFHAYRRLDSFDDARPLKPWLFRIAHNRCIDFLRSRGAREDAEAGADTARRRVARRSAGSRARPRDRASRARAAADGARVRAAQGRARPLARGDRRARRIHASAA